VAAQDAFKKLSRNATCGKAGSLRGGGRHRVMSHETPAGVMRGNDPSPYLHGPLLPPTLPPTFPHRPSAGRGV
jgi:hypothetical protein